jgi:hypothetical protein
MSKSDGSANQEPSYERVEPDDPRRCQHVTVQGQCLIISHPGSKYCYPHGGASTAHAAKRKELRNYRLTKWKARVQEKGDSEHIKSLRDELGILRVILEERLESCKSSMDLILHSGQISDMVMKIERVVSSCHKLEGSMGQLLDKSAILQFASQVLTIIGDEVQDEAALARIADRITNVLD